MDAFDHLSEPIILGAMHFVIPDISSVHHSVVVRFSEQITEIRRGLIQC